MSNKVLVIGAKSTFAKDLITLLSRNMNIITAGRSGCDVYCDVTESFDIPKGVDTIINVYAAFGGVTDKEIYEAFETNTKGALNVCIAAKKAGVRHIVNISSMSATLDRSSPYYSIYAVTKRQADEITQYYCKLNGIAVTILRPTQIYGDNVGYSKHQPFLYEIINNARNGNDILIYGVNDPLRNYINSSDLSEVINRVITRRIEGIYPVMYPTDVSFSEIANTALRINNKGGEVVHLKNKSNIPNNIFVKDMTLYEKVDYFPKTTLEVGLRRIFDNLDRDRP